MKFRKQTDNQPNLSNNVVLKFDSLETNSRRLIDGQELDHRVTVLSAHITIIITTNLNLNFRQTEKNKSFCLFRASILKKLTAIVRTLSHRSLFLSAQLERRFYRPNLKLCFREPCLILFCLKKIIAGERDQSI